MKFDVIVSDPPWPATDLLAMSKVKRGAAANYSVMTIDDIKNLKVIDIVSDNSVLVLWVPSWLLQEGLDTMKAWGFRQTQTWIWVKTKKDPLETLKKKIRKKASKKIISVAEVNKLLDSSDLSDVLAFFMGRLFRQTHEIALVGVRGKAYKALENKSQRSVAFAQNLKHSAKPEALQDKLDLMFSTGNKLEMFARRARANWTCVGLECPTTLNEDIKDSIDRLAKL